MTQESNDDLPKVSDQLCFAVYSAAHAFNSAYKPLLEPLRLTYPQYLVLQVLWQEDGSTLKEIGQRLHLDSGTLTPVLKRLQAAGYVQRYRDAEDERLLRVDLTSEGRGLRSRAVEVWRSITARLGKSEEQLGSLRQAIDQLRPALASAD
ncbi:MAG TPA: MarR family transcriptional regulator [Microvirga sp.]|nr:MarR family transcriptional regulator [Microvirga sp.]